MRAIRIHEFGGPEVLQLDDVARPEPGPGQVLVRAHAIGVGTADQLVRTGRYPWQQEVPTIPGLEMAGEVVATGSGVNHLQEGDRVVVSAVLRRSCYAEYVVEDAEWVFPIPDGVDFDTAACLFNYRTAHHAVVSACRLRESDTIAIVGAAGGVGGAMIEIANEIGATTIAVVRGAEKSEYARGLGADHVIDTRTEDLKSAIMAATGGLGVDFFLDPVGGPGFPSQMELLAPLGTLVLYGIIDGWPPDDVYRTQRERAAESPAVRGFSMHILDHRPDIAESDTAHLLGLMADGHITPSIFARFPLEQAADAHAMLEDSKVLGKILLKPDLDKPVFATST